MAILFSEVTVSAGSDSQEFLVAGIPTEYDDLEDRGKYDWRLERDNRWNYGLA